MQCIMSSEDLRYIRRGPYFKLQYTVGIQEHIIFSPKVFLANLHYRAESNLTTCHDFHIHHMS